MSKQSDYTIQLLKQIAYHLSSREDCRNIGYEVKIGTDNNEEQVQFTPMRKVCPNRYRRCERDKEDVVTHVLKEHFPEIYIGVDEYLNTYANTTKLVKGTYNYQLSVNKRKRRWIRTK